MPLVLVLAGCGGPCGGDEVECSLAGRHEVADAPIAIEGEAAGDGFARRLVVYDADGDGQHDLVATAYARDEGEDGAGKAYVFYGPLGPGTAGAGTADWTALGEAEVDLFGYDIDRAGDLDGDGYDELLVGAMGADSSEELTETGATYLLYGSNEGYGPLEDAVVLRGVEAEDYLGGGVAGLGDVDGDGVDDFAVGRAFGSDDGGGVYLWFSAIEIEQVTSDADLVVLGDSPDELGHSGTLASGDLNGDGARDLVLGGGNEYGNEGLGRSMVRMLYGPLTPGTLQGEDLGVISGEPGFGESVSVGDLDGDGRDDIAVGDTHGENGWTVSTGTVSVFLSSDATRPRASATASVRLVGGSGKDFFGNSVEVLDVGGDGDADLLVGANGVGLNARRGAHYTWLGPLAPGTYGVGSAAITLEGSSDMDE